MSDAPVNPHRTPDNLLELLDKMVGAASRTRFFRDRLGGRRGARSLEEFRALPTVPHALLRGAPLADTLAEPDKVDWIVGASDGQSPDLAAIAESADEGVIRYEVFADAVRARVEVGVDTVCASIAPPHRRYFASEAAAMIIAAGASAHVFSDSNPARARETLETLRPQVVMLLSARVTEAMLPASTRLVVTINRERRMARLPQLDLLYFDGLGFLAQSRDLDLYELNSDVYYFEKTACGELIVTPLYARTQPPLRTVTGVNVDFVSPTVVRLIGGGDASR